MAFHSSEATARPDLSIVVPLYNEQENLAELYRRTAGALDSGLLSFELILVDDGSEDATSAILDTLAADDPRVVAIHLSRNFGHQAALSAGLDRADGSAVVLMDGDLQDPPELIPQFVRLWKEGNDVVFAVRQGRKEGFLKRACYHVFYRLLRRLSDFDIPLDSGDFCLLDRQVADVLRELPERLRFLRGLRAFAGFRQVGVPYDRDARKAGTPKYSFFALVRLAVDGLVSFSSYPLHLVTHLGLGSLALALALTLWVLIDAFTSGTSPRGWASLVVVVLFMSSIQLISLGIMAEYVRRLFIETKGRPTYIVRDTPSRRPLALYNPREPQEVAEPAGSPLHCR